MDEVSTSVHSPGASRSLALSVMRGVLEGEVRGRERSCLYMMCTRRDVLPEELVQEESTEVGRRATSDEGEGVREDEA